MSGKGYRTAALDDIEPVPGHDLDLDGAWKPVRHHLGVEAFGINAYVAGADGELLIEEHDESDGYEHQELYFVARGRAEFTIGGDAIDAPAGTFVFVHDPALTRKAVAREPDTAIVAMGAKRGEAFSPSDWETKRTADLPRAG